MLDDYSPSREIEAVLAQVHPTIGVDAAALRAAVGYARTVVCDVGSAALLLTMQGVDMECCPTGHQDHVAGSCAVVDITSRHVKQAVHLCLPGELARTAVSEGTKAVSKFMLTDANKIVDDDPEDTRSTMAGLQFDVAGVDAALFNIACGGCYLRPRHVQGGGRVCAASALPPGIELVLRADRGRPAGSSDDAGDDYEDRARNGIGTVTVLEDGRPVRLVRVDAYATVLLTSVAEYITAELMELAGNAARDHRLEEGALVITVQDIEDAIGFDSELRSFFHGTVCAGAGLGGCNGGARGRFGLHGTDLYLRLGLTTRELEEALEAEDATKIQAAALEAAEAEEEASDLAVCGRRGGTGKAAQAERVMYLTRSEFEVAAKQAGASCADSVTSTGAWRIARRAGAAMADAEEIAPAMEAFVEAAMGAILTDVGAVKPERKPTKRAKHSHASLITRALVVSAARSSIRYSLLGQRDLPVNEEDAIEEELQDPRVLRPGAAFGCAWCDFVGAYEVVEGHEAGCQHRPSVGKREGKEGEAASSPDESEGEGGEVFRLGDEEEEGDLRSGLSQIRRAQASPGLMLSKLAFQRKAMALLAAASAISRPALGALQTLVEVALVQVTHDAVKCARHRGSWTLTAADFKVALRAAAGGVGVGARVAREGRSELPWALCGQGYTSGNTAAAAAAAAVAGAAVAGGAAGGGGAQAERGPPPEEGERAGGGAGVGAPGAEVPLVVFLMSGDKIALSVDLSATRTVGELKQCIARVHGTPVSMQALFAKGGGSNGDDEHPLANNSTLAELRIGADGGPSLFLLPGPSWALEVVNRRQTDYGDEDYVEDHEDYSAGDEQGGSLPRFLQDARVLPADVHADLEDALQDDAECRDRGHSAYGGVDYEEQANAVPAGMRAHLATQQLGALEALTGGLAVADLCIDPAAFELAVRAAVQEHNSTVALDLSAAQALQLFVESRVGLQLQGARTLAESRSDGGGCVSLADFSLACDLNQEEYYLSLHYGHATTSANGAVFYCIEHEMTRENERLAGSLREAAKAKLAKAELAHSAMQ
jgi:histone H3/H4